MRNLILIVWALLLFAGCNQEETQSVKMVSDTYHKVPTGYTASEIKIRKTREEREDIHKREIEIVKLKGEENLELAKIEAKTKEEVKRIESEALKVKVFAEKEVNLQAQVTEKEIAATKENTLIQTQEKDLFFYQIAIAVIAALILIMLLVYYLIHRKNKLIEVKLHEEKLRHEATIQANTQHHEKLGRMLDIIADEGANEHVRHALIGILKEQTVTQELITYQPEDDEAEKETLDIEEEEVDDTKKDT